MNSVNANWMSESFQPVPSCSGWTNSVQAYCRFAIMIIAMSDAHSWNQRLLMFTALPPPFASARCAGALRRPAVCAHAYTARVAGIGTPSRSPSSTTAPTTASSSIGRPASSPAASTSCARRPSRRRPCAGRSRSAARCRASPATASVSVMISRTSARRLGMARQLLERAAGQRADRVEGDVAQQLHPDLVAEARRDRAAEAGGDQRLGDRLAALRLACRRARRS